ncbi:MAG: DUF433 domain-containing protein [Alphaproteobacteria bacterium]|nr:MAG: DUF433 domain-containing protein [Alphaproteobacteria bacterium]
MLSKIVVSPGICHGKARIKGTRVPVHIILDLLAAGEAEENILMAYPQITKEDMHECLLYAAILAGEEISPIRIEAS